MKKKSILIVNIDSKIPNLALAKVEKYYSDKGYFVYKNAPIAKGIAEMIYVSCVFSWNKHKCKPWEGIAEVGGSGYDLNISLPDEIENVQPRINLGFTTRGCIRRCKFCIVPKKEGKIHAVGDLLDLWDGKAKSIVVLDNNILALPSHFELVCKQAHDNKLKVDFNQGLDHRLLTEDIVKTLKTVMHKDEFRFAFDHPSYLPSVERAIKLLQKHGLRRMFWYVLVGFDTTFEEDLFRLNYLRKWDQTVFVQLYNYNRDPKLLLLSRWANSHPTFKATTFDKFALRFKNKKFGKGLFK